MFTNFNFQQILSAFIVLFAVIDIIGAIPIIIDLKDKGKDVMKACSVGCIGCHLCEKNCPKDAVHVIDNVAYIDQEKCVGCGICAQKCPKKIIL